ncbi:MAG: cell division protein FtsB [Luminiphilus sp.]|nr:cell division protein FtsB [Luminiphilus sp.]MDG1461254.1 cell division protein FtsB [Luminiphilus sp.]
MRILAAVLMGLMVFLQYRLWFGDGGIAEGVRLQEKIVVEKARNAELKARNDRLEHQVLELRNGHLAVEQHAREELGLVKDDETYFQFVEPSEPVSEQP